ncbi:aldehyde dehydrogenase (NADP(+)) [Acrocarpospora macrocephala]|uniref:Aldehyde dehydrogenase n=1 Tax=Acrocarpospora macrocephala TaxID=150177 RepID=A0A5M3X6C8_9ACTN|nr:aldehyde dehydrogenase (NADP(+)) [Acrocarpospora macrocephala]GES15231.1 aldehyde dehydrogenase [Acrocarpospora macrocephala]
MIIALDPRTGRAVGEPIPESTEEQVVAIVEAAATAGRAWRVTPAAERAIVLEAVADALMASADDLWRAADTETALGEVRLRGEIARSAGQFRLFAEVLRDGGYLDAIIDHADPQLTPPRPDIRRMNQPLPGVVGVFAASNFPFAFSVAGGDVASALAAGCPVVVKAHPGHPVLSGLVATVIQAALPEPELLGLVQGADAGRYLVQHPAVAAVGFTGSIHGGKAIQGLINERPDPIPFYGELGSVNPVIVLPSALNGDVTSLATGFAGSLTLGVGQFCTNPGLLFVPDDDTLLKAIAHAVSETTGGPMLTPKIRDGYEEGVARLALGATELAIGQETAPTGDIARIGQEGASGDISGIAGSVVPRVFVTDLGSFADRLPDLAEECFGPAALVVKYRDISRVGEVLERLPGSLTATVHATDPAEAEQIADVLTRLAGRVIWNGWPTGVAVCWAMHHGGPWPASTSAAHTSVGATAISRWLAPVAYQNWPDTLLPPELRDDNPLNVPRRVDGSR